MPWCFFVSLIEITFCFLQLKYHDTGREKDCLPQVGQWNMMNKVAYLVQYTLFFYAYLFIYVHIRISSQLRVILYTCIRSNYIASHVFVYGFGVVFQITFLCASVFDLLLLFQKMVNGGTVNNWICINFSRNVQDSVARGFCYELAQMCYISGMVRGVPFIFTCTSQLLLAFSLLVFLE